MPQTTHTHPETRRQPAPVASKGCSCGCTSHQETCCQLDCLTQPRFFGGQLLADTDLNQLLTWTKDNFGLSRLRHGWGVVCGLEVQCDSGAQAVRVSPGYAVDCCGNDIVVCEDATISLEDACCFPHDPCATPEKRSRDEVDEGRQVDFFGCQIPERELREKILTIHYSEVPSDFQTALGQAYAGETNCQASRTRESFTLAWTDPIDAQVATVQHWKNEYNACREVVEKFMIWQQGRAGAWSDRPVNERWENIRDWILKWIDGSSGFDAHPLYEFCWLRECLCNVNEEIFTWLDQYVSNTLFWLAQDCRNHALQTACSNCPDNQGVPLARVCLWVPRREACRVVALDPYPPHRRPLRLDSWPALPGFVNIGQAIWQPPDQARALLMEMGLTVVGPDIPFQINSDPASLHRDLESELFVERDERVRLQVFDAQGCLGQRVVGVQSAPPSDDRIIVLEEAIARATAAAKEARVRADELAQQLRERDMAALEEETPEDVTERDADATKASSARQRRRR